MLQAKTRNMVAQRQQKMIAPIMPRTEQRAGFLDQLLIMNDLIGRNFDSPIAVACQMEIVGDRAVSSKVDSAVVQASRNGRVDQRV
jgi:hypothetical protein